MLGKQEYFCHQGKDYNKGKKEKYIEKKNVALKARSKSRKQTKILDCPVNKVGTDNKNNREKLIKI